MKKYLSFLLFLYLISNELSATHIVGGEMNYECLGDDQYRINLQIFRDCETGIPYFDRPASIGVFGSEDTLIYDLRMMPMGDDTLNPQLQNPCLVIPPTVCYHSTVYDTIVTLPFRKGGYQLAYQRCCRNQSIVNIQTPLAAGATYYSFISEEALLGCNRSAQFNDWAPFYICANFPFEFEHFALDTDGDSIVYELCAPFSGANEDVPRPQPPNPPPYDSVQWVNPPYNTQNMMSGIPLKIDPQTGLLTATPDQLGQYVVGICAKEYRNGILISTTRRDFQFNVGECGLEVVSSFFAPEVLCSNTLDVYFDNQSAGSNSFFWDFGDPATTDDFSSEFSPTYTYPDTGIYQITLIVGMGASACTDTFSREINVQYQSLNIDFDLFYNNCNDTLVIDFIDISTDSISEIIEWNWDFGNNTNSTEQFPTINYDIPGDYEIILNVLAENGCTASDTAVVYFGIPNFNLPNIQPICDEQISVELNPDGNPEYDYVWSPIIGLNDPFSPNPTATVTEPITYHVDISTYNNFDTCTVMDSVQVILSSPPPLFVEAEPDTVLFGKSSQLTATQNPDYTYTWLPDASLNFNDIYNPVSTPDETTTYTVQITDASGCKNEAFVTIYVIQPDCDEPYIFVPNAFTPNNDGDNDRFRVRSSAVITDFYFTVYNRWGEQMFETRNLNDSWDGTFKGRELPPDVYGFYVQIRCANNDDFFKKGNVTLIR